MIRRRDRSYGVQAHRLRHLARRNEPVASLSAGVCPGTRGHARWGRIVVELDLKAVLTRLRSGDYCPVARRRSKVILPAWTVSTRRPRSRRRARPIRALHLLRSATDFSGGRSLAECFAQQPIPASREEEMAIRQAATSQEEGSSLVVVSASWVVGCTSRSRILSAPNKNRRRGGPKVNRSNHKADAPHSLEYSNECSRFGRMADMDRPVDSTGSDKLADPVIFAARWRAGPRGWSLEAPAACPNGHPFRRGAMLVGWDNQVPAPALYWLCRSCGAVTWAADPRGRA